MLSSLSELLCSFIIQYVHWGWAQCFPFFFRMSWCRCMVASEPFRQRLYAHLGPPVLSGLGLLSLVIQKKCFEVSFNAPWVQFTLMLATATTMHSGLEKHRASPHKIQLTKLEIFTKKLYLEFQGILETWPQAQDENVNSGPLLCHFQKKKKRVREGRRERRRSGEGNLTNRILHLWYLSLMVCLYSFPRLFSGR